MNEVFPVNAECRESGSKAMAIPLLHTKYDYRQKWFEITETFSACRNIQEIYDQYLEWLSQTFAASRITLWKRFNVDGRFYQIRSVNTEDPPPPIAGTHGFVQRMLTQKGPFWIDEADHEDDDLKELRQYTWGAICVPFITTREGLLGFCTLSNAHDDQNYDDEDFDLLRVIAHHVTMLILQFQLVEEWSARAKWEAVHKFSGFYLHDLKNLASSLSLVVQNSEQYGHDPDFQASAMRTVRNTSQSIVDLIAKFADESINFDAERVRNIQDINMNVLIQETLEAFKGKECTIVLHEREPLPNLQLQVEPIKQVLLNVLLNAQQAMNGKGTIDITTTYNGQHVCVEVLDAGPGVPAAHLESLFQPFKSSKKLGLGVGLFQCKQIVEDNHGQIYIESQEGQGAKVVFTFPVESPDK